MSRLVRWRDTPRRTLRRWDLDRGYALYAITWGGSYVIAASNLGYQAFVLDGRERVVTILVGLVSLAVAVAMTWLAVLYLRRPVLDEPPRIDVPGDVHARAESERRAWRNR